MSVRNYAILYGGVRRVSGGASIGGGNALLSTEQHALDGAEHTAATDTDRLLATTDHSGLLLPLSGSHEDRLRGDGTWDGSNDTFLTSSTGERHIPETVTAGATETLDLETANTFDVTLTDDLTITLSNPPASGVEGRWTIVLRQDGTGGWTVTWPASVVWRDTDGTQTTTPATLATAADALDTIDLRTLDGGVSYGASLENGSNGAAGGAATRWELAVIPGSPPDNLYADGDWLYIEVPV